jgi:hypothetical protein
MRGGAAFCSALTLTVFWTRHSCRLRTVAEHFIIIIRFYQGPAIFSMRPQLSVVGITLQSIDLAAVTVNKTIRSTQSSNAFPVQEFKFTDARFPLLSRLDRI